MNVIINDLSGFFEARDRERMESFGFQVREEIFHGGIIPTISAPRHGRRDGLFLELKSIAMGNILVTLVRVQKQTLRKVFLLLGLFESLKDKIESSHVLNGAR